MEKLNGTSAWEIEGPYPDGAFSYRGWRLEQRPCEGPDCVCGKPRWYAYNTHEMSHEQSDQVWVSAGGTNPYPNRPHDLSRHVAGDYYRSPTIQDCIDTWEAEAERQFRVNLASALKGEP